MTLHIFCPDSELLDKAKELMENGSFEEARQILLDISGFRNADELAERCITGASDYRRRTTYEHAFGVLNNKESTESELVQAAEDFEVLGDYEDAENLAAQCQSKAQAIREKKYCKSCELMKAAGSASEMLSACEELEMLGSYKDSAELAKNGRNQLERYKKYENAVNCLNEAQSIQQLIDVIDIFRSLGDFLDCKEKINSTYEKIYEKASLAQTFDEISYAADVFEVIKDYKDSEKLAVQYRNKAKELYEKKYSNACELMSEAKSSSEMIFACEELESLGSYKDSAELSRNGRNQLNSYKEYERAVKSLNEAHSIQQLMVVIEAFLELGNFIDSKEMCNCAYEKVYEIASMSQAPDELNYAAAVFEAIKNYKDAGQRALECRQKAVEITAQKEKQAKEEADELELQQCLSILNSDARIKKIEIVRERLVLIKEHNGAEEALAECDKKIQHLKKRRKRNIIIVIAAVCLISVFIIFSCAFLPEIKYSNAKSLAEQGKYVEAAQEFEQIYNYKDSRQMSAKMRAKSYIEQGKIDEAVSLLKNAGLYDLAKECSELLV